MHLPILTLSDERRLMMTTRSMGIERRTGMALALWRGATRVAALATALALIMALVPFGAALARAQDDLAEADATIRVVHASPGAPEVDVLLDGQPLMEGIAYGTASDYMTITPESHRLQVVPTGQAANAAVVDETLDAVPGQAYVLAVFGLLNDIGGAIYDVDLSEIEPGNARVRLINFSPDAGPVDLLETGGDEWFGDVDLGEVSDYRDIAPGSYSADLRGDEDRVLRTIPDLSFEETRVYDVIVLGQVADDSIEVRALVTDVSPPCAEVLGLDGAGSDACIRLVHAAPDAPPIDVYLNDAQIAQGLEYGTATEYAATPSGAGRGIRVTAQDAPVEEATIDTGLDFDPGQAYEILINGAGEDLGLTITGTDLRPVAEGQSRVRIIHASPDAGAVDIGVEGREENLFEGVDFGDATNYIILDAGDYPIEVRPGGEDMTVALQSDITLEEGVVYDLVVLGRPSDQSLALLALTAEVPIQIGEVATPEAVSGSETVAATVVPETIEADNASPTPTS
jgi:hypothetical protein